MGSAFTEVYNRFLGQITDDMYMETTPEETLRDLQSLLIQALPGFEFPRKNILDYELKTLTIPEDQVVPSDFVIGVVWEDGDDVDLDPDKVPDVLIERSYFAEELTAEEQNILAILMMNGWLQRQVTSVENTRMKYSGSDYKMTSQANHLAKLQSLLGECQRQSIHYQRLYKRREINPKNGQYQSTWYWFGEHGTTNIR